VDEAHERTVHTDVLLGLLKGVAARRGSGLRLVIMSATLDAGRFAGFFGGARAVRVVGRQYPVQVRVSGFGGREAAFCADPGVRA
jgi:HrpA-like RNA helicase